MTEMTIPFPGRSLATAPTVLHVRVVCGHGGGPDKNILQATRYTDPSSFRLAAAYLHPPHDRGIHVLRFAAEDAGCPFYAIPDTGPFDPRSALAAFQLCRDLNVAVWHAHDYKSNFLGLILRCAWPMKLVTTMHGWTRETLRTRFYYRIDRQCIERYDRVITVGPTLHQARAAMNVPPQRETYIPNAIDLEGYARRVRPAQRRQSLGLPGDRVAIGVVSRLSVEKGVDRALHAFAALRRVRPDCDLHIIGAGPEDGRLRALAQQLQLGDSVRFWGWQRQPQPYYEMMDLLLLPSRTEGMPNVVLEAMAMNVPVAATDVGGVRELLDGGRCGVILGGDESAWHTQLLPLLLSPVYRTGMALAARRRVEEHYSYRRWVERVNAVYADVLGLNRAAQEFRRAA